VVTVTNYTLFVTSPYGVYSRLQTKVLAKFVDTTCIHGRWSSGKAWGAVKGLRAMETFQKQKDRDQVYLFLFINHVDLKNNNRKLFLIIWGNK